MLITCIITTKRRVQQCTRALMNLSFLDNLSMMSRSLNAWHAKNVHLFITSGWKALALHLKDLSARAKRTIIARTQIIRIKGFSHLTAVMMLDQYRPQSCLINLNMKDVFSCSKTSFKSSRELPEKYLCDGENLFNLSRNIKNFYDPQIGWIAVVQFTVNW